VPRVVVQPEGTTTEGTTTEGTTEGTVEGMAEGAQLSYSTIPLNTDGTGKPASEYYHKDQSDVVGLTKTVNPSKTSMLISDANTFPIAPVSGALKKNYHHQLLLCIRKSHSLLHQFQQD
jgi:hypothetical protein